MGTKKQQWGVTGWEHNTDCSPTENHNIIIKILSGRLYSPFTSATKASEADAINRMNPLEFLYQYLAISLF